jgi:hypothetical protein
MLRLLFGFWFLSNIRTREQRKKGIVKQLFIVLVFTSASFWFSNNNHSTGIAISAPKQSVEYITESGHRIVYDHKQGKYTSNY